MISASPQLSANPVPFPSLVRSVALTGPAGRLEAILNSGAPDAPFAALVCHPHPLGGGNLHNKVVYHAMKVLNAPEWGLGLPVLRFNFRGTGLSDGAHDGSAETGDVLAALDWLDREFQSSRSSSPVSASARPCASRPVVSLCDPRLRAIALLGPPLRPHNPADNYPTPRTPAACPSSSSAAIAIVLPQPRNSTTSQLPHADPKQLVLIPGADHFFTDQLEPMQNRSHRLVEGAIAMTPVSDTALETHHTTATEIFTGALKACNIATAFDRRLRFDGHVLHRLCPTAAAPPPSISPHTSACS